MSFSLQNFVNKTSVIETTEELIACFLKEMASFGYDRMAFCLLSDHSDIGLEAGVGYINNYPSDWLSHYFANGFDQFDPVLSYGRQKLGTFSWDEIKQRMPMTKKQEACLYLGEESKLFNGNFTPLWGPHRFSGISLATSEKTDACSSCSEMPDLITAYCNHFYVVFQRLHQDVSLNNEFFENVYLTPLEKEVLTWAAQGKSDNDIGEIMGMSHYTVNYHLRKIFKRLNAHSRIVAISKAIYYGLIHL